MRGTSYEVHIAVIEPLKPGDEFYDDFTYYNRVKTISALVIPSMIIAFILLLATLIYLCYAAGKNEKGEKLPLNFRQDICRHTYAGGTYTFGNICILFHKNHRFVL